MIPTNLGVCQEPRVVEVAAALLLLKIISAPLRKGFNLMFPTCPFSAKFLSAFTKKALICPVVEQIGSKVLSKIKMRIRINLATPLKIGLIHRRNTYCVWEEERHSCIKNKVEDFFRH